MKISCKFTKNFCYYVLKAKKKCYLCHNLQKRNQTLFSFIYNELQMTHLRNIFLIFIIFLVGVSCKQKHHIQICSYQHSDSLSYMELNEHNHIGLISEISLFQLTTDSDDPNEQRIVKNINNFIINEINSQYKDEIPDSIVVHIVRDNMEGLLTNIKEKDWLDADTTSIQPLYDDTELADTLYNKINAECHFGLGDTILCLKIISTVYTGGAHPGKDTYCYSFSLNNGNMIRPNKIVTKENMSELLNRIKLKLMAMKHFKNEDELEANGFKEIMVSPYIMLEKDSVAFFYESYSIAPFCEGDINIKFSYKELEDISLLKQ